jgi:manganese/zinc/iron transport system permease protein
VNPYFDTTFFSFFGKLFHRLFQLATGQIQGFTLATDEIQILVLMLVGVSAALVGAFLVLRKMTMLANSLSHTILLGIILAFLLGSSAQEFHEGHLNISLMFFAALLAGLLTAIATEILTKSLQLQEDASLGLVFTTFFALGIIIVNLWTRDAHIGAEVVMGNVDALHADDIRLALVILCLNVLCIFIFYKEWQITTFDPPFAKAMGISPQFFNYFLMTLVSLTIVGAFRAVGVLMVLTFVTAPPLTARLFCSKLSHLLLLSSAIGCMGSILGVALSRHLLTVYGLALSTGGLVVILLGSFFLLCLLLKKGTRRRIFLAPAAEAAAAGEIDALK